MDYAQNGNLASFQESRPQYIDERLLFVFAFQICLGLEYMHMNKIYHRNLNLNNILLDNKSNLKLGDYGWFVHSPKILAMLPLESLDYIAPEILMSRAINEKSDTWS